MAPARLAALDLGSGTIKLSVFEKAPAGWQAVCLEEANTELRRGMGPESMLKPGPVADTFAACRDFIQKAAALGARQVPAYATSAVRKARNPQILRQPLAGMGIRLRVLTEEEEGRWNLLGALAAADSRPRLSADLARAGARPGPALARLLVIDPGGDSTECTADLGSQGWQRAMVASLPFGSVSLQETYGSAEDNLPLDWGRLQRTRAAARAAALGHETFRHFVGPGLGLLPAIRMNLPIQRALESVNHLPAAPHGQGGRYTRDQLEALTRHTAALEHVGRAALLDGEPLGKVDRTCYGFASWLGILDALEADGFHVEPWGIKLGAVIALNEETAPEKTLPVSPNLI